MIPDFSAILDHDFPAAAAAQAYAAAVCLAKEPPTRLLLADMTQVSASARLWVLDLVDPKHPQVLLRSQVAHGYGSDPQRTGRAMHFSDVEGSGMTSLGLYRVDAAYLGKHGHSYRLMGLSPSNAHAYARDVTMHPAAYVTATSVGRSAGCAAVSPRFLPEVEQRWGSLTGAFLYIAGAGLAPTPCASPVPSSWYAPPRWVTSVRPSSCTLGASV